MGSFLFLVLLSSLLLQTLLREASLSSAGSLFLDLTYSNPHLWHPFSHSSCLLCPLLSEAAWLPSPLNILNLLLLEVGFLKCIKNSKN
ncbi:unnamed protein product [Microthlaspi erraticum]|uniref:Secreted protein n=1 Tax=Microthlaspi erraticum TaxID=1685480 RepID=A0A6D2I593_9BRAS|nr:unnamed protein product [Microthlaspi erraticum]